MKTKIIIAGLMAIVFSFSSCNKKDDASSSVASTVAQSSDARMADLAIASATYTSSSDSIHPKCKLTEVAVSSLPSSIAAYVSTNYPGATIQRAGTNQDGKYVVGIQKSDGSVLGLIFDASGNFVSVAPIHPHPELGKPINVANLPAAITTYINANYSGSTIARAFQNSEGKYFIEIQKSDSTKLAMGFDANGNFITEFPAPHCNGGPGGPGGHPDRN